MLRTPTVPSPGLSGYLGASVTLKLELLQRTGSFKVRGAFHKLLTLVAEQRAAGVAAVSGGNHGLAVADAAGTLGIAATVVMPEAAPARSVEACRARRRRAHHAGHAHRLRAARRAGRRRGRRWCIRSKTRW